jgi:hypothetical protein
MRQNCDQRMVKAGGPPIPDHPKLTSYCARRAAHLLKLCIIAAMASDSDRIVTLDHFAEALDWLVQLEVYARCFQVNESWRRRASDRGMLALLLSDILKTKEPVPEHRVVHVLARESVPVHNISRILDVMERSKLLEKKFTIPCSWPH